MSFYWQTVVYFFGIIVPIFFIFCYIALQIEKRKEEKRLTREFLLTVGRNCKLYRMKKGYSLEDVAEWSGYAKETVCGFEHGRNNNATILSWYVAQGMTFNQMTEGL